MSKLSVNRQLNRLSPKEFEKWWNKHNFIGDWKQHYKLIGGKIPKSKKNAGSSGVKSEDESSKKGAAETKSD